MNQDSDITPEERHELAVTPAGERMLTAEQFQQLSDVPAAPVWLGNINNPNTRRAYQADLEAFVSFCGIEAPEELRLVAGEAENATATLDLARRWETCRIQGGATGSGSLLIGERHLIICV